MGVAGPEWGVGTTNYRAQGGPMGTSTPKDRESDAQSRWQEDYSRIYAPERTSVSTSDSRVRVRPGEQGKTYTSVVGSAPDKAQASAPYYDVYDNYQQAAEDSLAREDIPNEYKESVKAYFESLRPK